MSLKVPLLAAIFALSGAAINLIQQQLYYGGAGDGSLLILIVPTIFGMMIGGLMSPATQKELMSGPGGLSTQLPRRIRQMMTVSVSDVTSLTLRSCAQNFCGSGMYTVIYASLPAFNGALSYFFLGRVLNRYQWLSMFVVVTGLACSVEAEEDSLSGQASTLRVVSLGIVFSLAGTLFSSASYIAAERVLKSADGPREATTLTAVNGINDMILATPWLLFYSVPHREDLLYKPVAEKGVSPWYLFFLWLCLIVANAAHLNSCYILMRITDSVTLTMLQGVRAVMVFAISGALFCSASSPEQCLSVQKVLCSCVVIFGVVMYARSTAGLSKHLNSSLVGRSSTRITENGKCVEEIKSLSEEEPSTSDEV